jgi:parallel beta-helix repeat protein
MLSFFASGLNPPIFKSIPNFSTAEDPIFIGSNSELDDFCCFEGRDGLSWETAYIIENVEIDGGNTSKALELGNTYRFLIIRNCTLKNRIPDTSYVTCNEVHASGPVWLRSCSNVKIIDCTLMSAGNAATFSLSDSENITLSNCNFENGTRGILLIENNNCLISGNRFNIIVGEGILAINSHYNTIMNNIGTVNGLYGILIEERSSYNQVYNNCFTGENLRLDVNDKGTNNNIYDNKCNLIPGYTSLVVLIASGSILVVMIAITRKRIKKKI